MDIKENVLLAPHTTFKIGGPARFFCVVENETEVAEALNFAEEKKLNTFILGGGSNLLVSDNGFNGLVIQIKDKGLEILSKDENSVVLKVASGEVWDEVVAFTVENNLWGIENLSHIAGCTGAIAVQNVGAYGQEAKDVIDSVWVYNGELKQSQILKNSDCGFSYRSSIFNTSEKGKYIIFSITFKLSKVPRPVLSYRDLQAKFEGKSPSLEEIRQAVIAIRDQKFPFPTEAKKGNAGSFFKNAVLNPSEFIKLREKIQNTFGDIKARELEKKKFPDGQNIKVPAAFLIELCGLKDLENGGAAINQNQPLVIINKTGTATAADVLGLANRIKQIVLEKTGIELVFEPELVGFD